MMGSKRLQKAFGMGVLIVVLGIGIAGYQGYTFVNQDVSQLENEHQSLKNKLNGKNNRLQKLQDFARNIENVKAELRTLNSQLETATEHMPRTFDLSGLLRRLTLLAQNSGLEISSFKPSKEIESKETFYKALEVSFTLKGTFTQTLTFLDQLSRLKRIVRVDSLSIRKGTQDPRLGTFEATTSANLVAYRFAE